MNEIVRRPPPQPPDLPEPPNFIERLNEFAADIDFTLRSYDDLKMNYEEEQVEKARDFLIVHKGADPDRLHFEQRNLYDLTRETRTFDEIICFDVLEHLVRDRDVLAQFFRILRPGGALHLCCPHRLHPRDRVEVLDTRETSGMCGLSTRRKTVDGYWRR